MSIRLDLDVHKSINPKRQSNPYVEIYVKSSQSNERELIQGSKKVLISNECYSMQDVDNSIQVIMNDLKEIRKKAEKELE